MSSPFKVAVVQSSPVEFEPNATLTKVCNEDGILLAEIDPADITRGKYNLDVVGHYARPDVFPLHVNEKPAPPVIID